MKQSILTFLIAFFLCFTIIGQTKCALFTNEMCKKKIFFHAKLKAFNQCLNSV